MGSQNEDEEVNEDVSCDGLLRLQGEREICAGALVPPYFHFTSSNHTTKTFCKASHLTRYLLVYYTKKGGNEQKKQKKNKSKLRGFTRYLFQLSLKKFRRLMGLSRGVVTTFITAYQQTLQMACGRPPVLLPSDEMILTLLWLRHYPVDLLLLI